MTRTWILGIGGLVLLAYGVVAVYLAIRAQRRVHAMMAAETLTVPELEALRGVSDELGNRGGFRHVAEVTGAAGPGPQGLLRAEMSGAESVWHAQRVQRHFERTERDSRGDLRTSRCTETVARNVSAPTFTVVRDGHAILVDHGGRHPDAVEQVVDRFEAASGFDDTVGYQYTEWVVRPGTPLYVLGEVTDRTGTLVIGPPQQRGGEFVVSTRSEEELTEATRRRQRLLSRTGAGSGVVGLVLLVLLVVL